MKKQIQSSILSINDLQNKSKQFSDQIHSLSHEDRMINSHIINLKKMSLQSIDIFNAMQQKLTFLSNAHKNHEFNENLKRRREETRKKIKRS